ncbi:hypothetical protein LCGC14_1620000 [marine sediment metagenome]|uniref:Recombination endonuclease VII n=1 Tax=marine sediment metagenome TaxID=412755 RepID=A0A0F9KLB7_9ZZZZ
MSLHTGKNTTEHRPEWFNKPYRRNGEVRTVRVCWVCIRANGRVSYARNSAHYLEAARQYRREHPIDPRKKRDQALRSKFGLTLEDYDRMFEAQGGVCAICGYPPKNKALNVDHNHDTGTIRGLLCGGCNSFLGRVQDDPNRLLTAAGYVTVGLPPKELE